MFVEYVSPELHPSPTPGVVVQAYTFRLMLRSFANLNHPFLKRNGFGEQTTKLPPPPALCGVSAAV